MNLARAGPGLSNTRWKNLTLDEPSRFSAAGEESRVDGDRRQARA